MEKNEPHSRVGVGQVQMARTSGGSETCFGTLHNLCASFKVSLPE